MNRTELNVEVAKVVDRLNHEVEATPTGPLRNLLTDARIIILTLQEELVEAAANLAKSQP